MPIQFDAANKRIILDSSSVTAEEVFSRWADWAVQSDNLKYGEVISHVGGTDLGGGLFIPNYLFLNNGWKVRPMESDHLLNIIGNLFVNGGGAPVVNTLGNYNVSVQYTVPVQAQAMITEGTGGSLTPQQIADEIMNRLSLTPISVNTIKIKGQTIIGTGAENDPWRPEP